MVLVLEPCTLHLWTCCALWIEDWTLGRIYATGKWMIIWLTPHKTTPLSKWMFFLITFLQIILAAKSLVRHSSTSPKQHGDDLCLLFCLFLLLWSISPPPSFTKPTGPPPKLRNCSTSCRVSNHCFFSWFPMYGSTVDRALKETVSRDFLISANDFN